MVPPATCGIRPSDPCPSSWSTYAHQLLARKSKIVSQPITKLALFWGPVNFYLPIPKSRGGTSTFFFCPVRLRSAGLAHAAFLQLRPDASQSWTYSSSHSELATHSTCSLRSKLSEPCRQGTRPRDKRLPGIGDNGR